MRECIYENYFLKFYKIILSNELKINIKVLELYSIEIGYLTVIHLKYIAYIKSVDSTSFGIDAFCL